MSSKYYCLFPRYCTHDHKLEKMGVPGDFAGFIEHTLNFEICNFIKVHDPTKSSQECEIVVFIEFDEIPNINADIKQHFSNLCKQSRGKGWFIPVEKTGIAFSLVYETEYDDSKKDPKLKSLYSFLTELTQNMKTNHISHLCWEQPTRLNWKEKDLFSSRNTLSSYSTICLEVPKSLYVPIA